MRFAWEKGNSAGGVADTKRFSHPLNLVMIAYNIVLWIPIILPLTGVIDYRAGFIAFLAVTVVRLVANLVRNNVLRPEKALDFPLRSP